MRDLASRLEAMPNEPCTICETTGLRKEPPERGAGDLRNGGTKCNACDGEGYRRPWEMSVARDFETGGILI